MVVGSGRLIKTGLAGIAGMNAAAVEKAYTFVVNKANDIAQRMGENEVEPRLGGGSKDVHVHIDDEGQDLELLFVESTIMVGLIALMMKRRAVDGVGVLGDVDDASGELLPLPELFSVGEVDMCLRAGLKVIILGGEPKVMEDRSLKMVYVRTIFDALPYILQAPRRKKK